MRNNEIKNEVDYIKQWKEKIKQKDFIYRLNKYKYNFHQFETIWTFVENIYTGKITLDEAKIQITKKLNQNTKKIRKKRNTFDSVNALYEGRELTLNALKSWIFSTNETQGKGLKILSPKQMLQRLPIALAQVKVGNTSWNLLNEIRQIIHYWYIFYW